MLTKELLVLEIRNKIQQRKIKGGWLMRNRESQRQFLKSSKNSYLVVDHRTRRL